VGKTLFGPFRFHYSPIVLEPTAVRAGVMQWAGMNSSKISRFVSKINGMSGGFQTLPYRSTGCWIDMRCVAGDLYTLLHRLCWVCAGYFAKDLGKVHMIIAAGLNIEQRSV
jgi:hypothetical protein